MVIILAFYDISEVEVRQAHVLVDLELQFSVLGLPGVLKSLSQDQDGLFVQSEPERAFDQFEESFYLLVEVLREFDRCELGVTFVGLHIGSSDTQQGRCPRNLTRGRPSRG